VSWQLNFREDFMARKSAPQPTASTRDRILDAAVLRFARHSYEETKLRDIASDVGVDVAYVHRCFCSKQHLFAEALTATTQFDRILASAGDDLAGALARKIVTRNAAANANEVEPLDIVIRSLCSAEATDVMRKFMLRDVIGPISRKLDDSATRRAALITAFLAGVSTFRNVLRVEELRQAKGGELEKMIAKAIKGMMGEDTTAETGLSAT
jgi:AcrR family transcriptional regulator